VDSIEVEDFKPGFANLDKLVLYTDSAETDEVARSGISPQPEPNNQHSELSQRYFLLKCADRRSFCWLCRQSKYFLPCWVECKIFLVNCVTDCLCIWFANK